MRARAIRPAPAPREHSPGADAAAIAPPAYGIDFADRNAAVVQRVKWGNLALGVLGSVGTLGALPLLSPGFRNFVSDAWYDPITLAEEQVGVARSWQTIQYTPLAAGCMAVTVLFTAGGGAGVHMAMQPQGGNQWANFVNAIGGRAIAQVFVDSEFVGDPQGWYVIPGGGGEPRSCLQLYFVDNLQTPAAIAGAGWRYNRATVLQWFGQALGVPAASVHGSTNTRPWHAIP